MVHLFHFRLIKPIICFVFILGVVFLNTSCTKKTLLNSSSQATTASEDSATSLISSNNSSETPSATSSINQSKATASSSKPKASSIIPQTSSVVSTIAEPNNPADAFGNIFANLQDEYMFSGFVVKQGEWIYYKDYSDNYALYRMKTDLSSKQKILSAEFSQLNVVGDWIYYTNMFDLASIYRVKTDGTQGKKLVQGEVIELYILGNWMYFIERKQLPDATGVDDKLYKAKLDGSEKTRLGTEQIQFFVIYQDLIYYSNSDNNNSLWKMKMDGTAKTKVLAYENVNTFFIGGDKIYCQVANNKIVESSLDGTSSRVLVNETYDNLHINKIGNYIIYTSCSTRVMLKININTNEITPFYPDFMDKFEVIDDWIYYTNFTFTELHHARYTFSRMHLDGSENQIICSGIVETYNW